MPTAARHADHDAALVRRIRAGDAEAREELVRRHRPALVRHAARLLQGHVTEPEDVVQDALMRALQHLGSSSGPIELRPWLHRIVRNGCFDELRRARRAPAVALDTEVADTRLDAHATAVLQQALRDVLRDVADLPEPQRVALLGRALAGESHVATAQALGISKGASKMLVHRARATLHDRRAARMACAA